MIVANKINIIFLKWPMGDDDDDDDVVDGRVKVYG